MMVAPPESPSFDGPRPSGPASNLSRHSGRQGHDREARFGSFLDACSEEQSATAHSGRELRQTHEDRDLSWNTAPINTLATASDVTVPDLDVPSLIPAVSIREDIEDSTVVSNPVSPVLDAGQGSVKVRAEEITQSAGPDQNRSMDASADADRIQESREVAFRARLYLLESDHAPSPTIAPTSLTPSPLQTGGMRTPASALENTPQDGPSSESEAERQNATTNTTRSGMAQTETNEPGLFVTAVSRPAPTQTGDRKPEDLSKEFDHNDPLGAPVTVASTRQSETRADAAVKEATSSNMNDVQPKSGPPPHAVSLRVAAGDRSVDIRMAERGGEIRVMVQTPDRHLAESLRQDLPDLVARLRHSGFQAETWKPQPAVRPDSPRQNDSGKFSGFSQQNQGSEDRKRQHRDSQARWISEWKASATNGAEVSL